MALPVGYKTHKRACNICKSARIVECEMPVCEFNGQRPHIDFSKLRTKNLDDAINKQARFDLENEIELHGECPKFEKKED